MPMPIFLLRISDTNDCKKEGCHVNSEVTMPLTPFPVQSTSFGWNLSKESVIIGATHEVTLMSLDVSLMWLPVGRMGQEESARIRDYIMPAILGPPWWRRIYKVLCSILTIPTNLRQFIITSHYNGIQSPEGMSRIIVGNVLWVLNIFWQWAVQNTMCSWYNSQYPSRVTVRVRRSCNADKNWRYILTWRL
jgi:hypothetical protein